MEHYLLPLPEPLISLQYFGVICVAYSLIFYVVSCVLSIVCLSFSLIAMTHVSSVCMSKTISLCTNHNQIIIWNKTEALLVVFIISYSLLIWFRLAVSVSLAIVLSFLKGYINILKEKFCFWKNVYIVCGFLMYFAIIDRSLHKTKNLKSIVYRQLEERAFYYFSFFALIAVQWT